MKYFRHRTPRDGHDDEPDLFEAFYVVLYETARDHAMFWPVHDVALRPPAARPPRASEVSDLDGAISDVVALYEKRSEPPFQWSAD